MGDCAVTVIVTIRHPVTEGSLIPGSASFSSEFQPKSVIQLVPKSCRSYVRHTVPTKITTHPIHFMTEGTSRKTLERHRIRLELRLIPGSFSLLEPQPCSLQFQFPALLLSPSPSLRLSPPVSVVLFLLSSTLRVIVLLPCYADRLFFFFLSFVFLFFLFRWR